MSEFVTMSEVPACIWNAVYKKWETALETGWQSNLWTRCTLCNWLGISGQGCVSCPINPCWCRCTPGISRINVNYKGDKGETWEENVKTYLEYIKPYCTGGDHGD